MRESRQKEAMMPSITGGHHIALTVSDVNRSAEWYSRLLNMQVALSGDMTRSVSVFWLTRSGAGASE